MNDEILISNILPNTSFYFINPPINNPESLYLEEKAFTHKMLDKRISEFCGGRLCAKQALAQLEIKQFPILIDDNRRPIWPINVVGSISHCNNLCVAAVDFKSNIKSIGIDIEEAAPLEEGLVEYICRERETLALDAHADPLLLAKLIFSLKESIYKCLNPIYSIWIDFHDVDISFSSGLKSAEVTLYGEIEKIYDEKPLNLKWSITKSHIVTCAWV